MARKTSPAVSIEEPTTVPQLEQDFQTAAELGQQLAAVDSSYGDNLPYDRHRVVNEMRFFMNNATAAILEVGKRLILLKEHESSEDFRALMAEMNLDRRLVQRVIQATAKCAHLGPTKTQKLIGLSQVKLFELMVLDDEDLAELADGGTVADLKLDDIDRMTSTELRAALRRSRTENTEKEETYEQLLVAKDQKINALDRELVERSRSTSVKPWPEQAAAMNNELATLSLLATESIAHIHTWNQALELVEVPDDTAPADDPRRTLVLSLHDAVSRLASLIGGLQQSIYDNYPLILAEPVYELQDVQE